MFEREFNHLLQYHEKNNYAGWDPYDGLESVLIAHTPLRSSRLFRLTFIQIVKRSPFNFRRILYVPKRRNPKGIALCVLALLNVYRKTKKREYLSEAEDLLRWLQQNKADAKNTSWGYPFSWQSRAFYVKKNKPNAVATVFATMAFLEGYEITRKKEYLEVARQATTFFLEDLNRTETKEGVCFSYTPHDKGQVHNVNLLVSLVLFQVGTLTGKKHLIRAAEKALKYSIKKQNKDGSWYYGEDSYRQWIDNFHTGYNLIALKRIAALTNKKKHKESLEKGYQYYKKCLFGDNWAPKYYVDKLYPIDIHAIATAIITFSELSDIDSEAPHLAQKIARWSIREMYDAKEGYFYFQKGKRIVNKISYLRWAQSWMLFALSYIHKENRTSVSS